MQVRFADTDAQGHVYFANYLTFCDEALAAFMRHRGCPWQELVAGGVDMVYRASSAEYLGSAAFEMRLEIEPRVERIGTTSVTIGYAVRGPDAAPIAKLELTSVCVDAASGEPVEVPARLRAALDSKAGE